jgi:hypothetical protein
MNAFSFAYLMEQCQSLKVLTLTTLEIDEDHIRVLDAYSRPDLEIELHGCTITSVGTSALVEVLGRNQGPTKLVLCRIDNLVLANGLRGNSRLKSLTPRFSDDIEVGNPELLAIVGAVNENKGMVDLDLKHAFSMNDETWGAVCDSLEAHPTIEVLNLHTMRWMTLAPAVLKFQIQKLVDMLKVNASIHTIHLGARHYQHELYRGSVIPYLETNRFRPRLLAIQRSLPIVYRAKVLGRVLVAVRTDPNRFWMLLSGNAEVAFPSTTGSIAAVASLPTPTTAIAADTVMVASIVATTSTAAAYNIVAPADAGQKRKACP